MSTLSSTRKRTSERAPQLGLAHQIRKHRNLYLFVIPGLVFFIVFRYVPVYFVQIAFRSYRVTRAVSDAPWVGFRYFRQLFNLPGFTSVLWNTIVISFYKLIFTWPAPILIAILLNEMRSQRFKRVTQTIIYLPHFISWVVLGGIIMNFLSVDGGLVNKLLDPFLERPVFFLGERALFRPILVLSEVWKETGWASIIYLASITRISPELYEASIVDGANRWQMVWNITIPGILDVMVVLLILRLGNLLSVGFEQNIVLVNDLVRETGEILDTYVWRLGLQEGRFSLAAAAGLFKTVIAAILLNTADRVSKRLGQQGLL